MMDFRSCLDWCRSCPTFLISFLLLLVIIVSLSIYAIRLSSEHCDAAHNGEDTSSNFLEGDLEKQQCTTTHISRVDSQWRRLLAYCVPRNQEHASEAGDADDVECQEKTPLIGSATNEGEPPGYHGWQTSPQLALNWHGTNQLNTSWGWMA